MVTLQDDERRHSGSDNADVATDDEMSSPYAFGIDVGTRTTVIEYFDASLKSIQPFAIEGGKATIPSFYSFGEDGTFSYGEALIDRVSDTHNSTTVIKDFKIDFWNTDNPTRESLNRLQGWIAGLYGLLRRSRGDDIDNSSFCFTFPAQRNALEPVFRKMIQESGFASDRLVFLDEPTAAAYSMFGVGRDNERQALIGKGMVLDVGAGTTDYTLLENRGGRVGITIIDSSSTNLAGNAFTRAMRGLVQPESEDAFSKVLETAPWILDKMKEQASDYYREPDNHDEQFAVKKGDIRVASNNFHSFLETVQKVWHDLMSDLNERLLAAKVQKEDLRFLLLCGGGALHSALVEHARREFGDIVVVPKNPQTIVAEGACKFARFRFTHDEEQFAPISSSVSQEVSIEFPIATKQGSVIVLKKGQQIPLKEKIMSSEPIRLKSNLIFSEGEITLHVGTLKKSLGKIDISWSTSDEGREHDGIVEWEYLPHTAFLNLVVKLSKTKLLAGSYFVSGQAEVPVKTMGTYHPR